MVAVPGLAAWLGRGVDLRETALRHWREGLAGKLRGRELGARGRQLWKGSNRPADGSE